jgi:acyl transferase domain-containing protein/acyl carrier protein
MAGRFPGASSIDELWRLIIEGREGITRFTEEQLVHAGVPRDIATDEAYVPVRGVLDEAEDFDASFFGMSPRESELTDPQQRVFLEAAWHAVEDAGYDAERIDVPVGVFAGAGLPSYWFALQTGAAGTIDPIEELQLLIGNDKDYLAPRASYKLDFHGPSITVQTACSTSLVAVHMACQSLLLGECDMALAGGVAVRIPQLRGYLYQQGGTTSSDGHCRAFDADASGMVPGNGVGVVVLKRVRDAIQDGDAIRAVIRGSAVNNDGSRKTGFTAPSVDQQASVIAEALAVAGLDAGDVGLVETHGTGTRLGDPIEVAALASAFGTGLTDRSCAIGSVKTNVGHLDAAAGITGLIKATLAVLRGVLPPSLNFSRPNPDLGLEGTPFFVNTSAQAWPEGRPRVAAVTSLGVGGTNAHVVLEQPPSLPATVPMEEDAGKAQILAVSARTHAALDAATTRLADHLSSHPEIALGDVAFTLAAGRRKFEHRRAIVAASTADAVDGLRDHRSWVTSTAVSPHTILMFPGAGGQYPNMAGRLMDADPKFRATIEGYVALAREHVGPAIDFIVACPDSDAEVAEAALRRTPVAFASAFIMGYAIGRRLLELNVEPAALVGHSVGEYVAACLAEAMEVEDAIQLVSLRGALLETLPASGMLQVSLAAETLAALLPETLEIAAFNGDTSCVVGGPSDALSELEMSLRIRGIEANRVAMSAASHTSMVTDILPQFEAAVGNVRLSQPTLPWVSTATGEWVDPALVARPQHWIDHFRRPVQFRQALHTALAAGAPKRDRLLVEAGPGNTLAALVRRDIAAASGATVLSVLPHRRDGRDRYAAYLASIARLWTHGVAVDYAATTGCAAYRRVPLPGYPFERKRSSLVAAQGTARGEGLREAKSTEALAKRGAPDNWLHVPSWRQSLVADVEISNASAVRWLVLVDDSSWGGAFAAALSGADVTVVGRRGPDDDADEVAHWLGAPTTTRSAVVVVGVAAEDAELRMRCMLALAKVVEQAAAAAPVDLTFVTRQAFDVLGGEATVPDGAVAVGAALVLPQEAVGVRCRVFDVTVEDDPKRVSELLRREIGTDQHEPLVAARRGRRWVVRYDQVMVPTPIESALPTAPGACVVTGGTRGVGLAIAEHVAVTAGLKLVLISRSPMPDPSTDEESAERASALARIRGRTEAFVAVADVSDRAALTSALARARQEVGPIRMVVHAAGMERDGPIAAKDAEEAVMVMRSKVAGVKHLVELTADDPVSLYLSCSSINSVLGGYGKMDIVSANAFLDSFAATHGRSGRRHLTVSWDTWREVGMAVRHSGRMARSRREELLAKAMSVREGLEVLDRAAALDAPHVVVFTANLEAALERNRRFLKEAAPALSTFAAGTDGTGPPAARSANTTSVKAQLATIWAELLGVPGVGDDEDFFDLGGDSVVAIRVRARAADLFSVDLPLRTIFENPTVSQLANAVEDLAGA